MKTKGMKIQDTILQMTLLFRTRAELGATRRISSTGELN